jgi:hypothetical protein
MTWISHRRNKPSQAKADVDGLLLKLWANDLVMASIDLPPSRFDMAETTWLAIRPHASKEAIHGMPMAEITV